MLRIFVTTFNDERVWGLFDCHFLNSWARTKIKGVLEWWSVGLYKTSIKSDNKIIFKNVCTLLCISIRTFLSISITLSDNLNWSQHITTTTTKANARLSFIKRNLKDCPKTLKELAYFSLVRSFTDYCSTVWDPHQKYNHDKLEMVRRSCVGLQDLLKVQENRECDCYVEWIRLALFIKKARGRQTYSVLQNY